MDTDIKIRIFITEALMLAVIGAFSALFYALKDGSHLIWTTIWIIDMIILLCFLVRIYYGQDVLEGFYETGASLFFLTLITGIIGVIASLVTLVLPGVGPWGIPLVAMLGLLLFPLYTILSQNF